MSEGSASKTTAHVIVFGNEKGGSGKSTTAINVAVGLLQSGLRVATIDLDARQGTLTRYVENRRRTVRERGLDLALPSHYAVPRASGTDLRANEAREFGAFADALSATEPTHDVIVIDTPGSDTYLMRLAHSLADTLVTPMNDSFVDFDVLGRVDPETQSVVQESHYAAMVREARRQRELVDGGVNDWVILRNRLPALANRNSRALTGGLEALAAKVGCRLVDGIAERVVYREFFPRGFSALDPLDDMLGNQRPSLSHLAARTEVRALIAALRLPVFKGGREAVPAVAPAPVPRLDTDPDDTPPPVPQGLLELTLDDLVAAAR